jgi:M6 family metalloprotease-like protein
MKKKSFFVFVIFAIACQNLFAVPANPAPGIHLLPDSSEITIRLHGNEWVNWRTTLDGYTILRNADGFFEYAVQDDFGDLKLSGVRARDEAQRTAEDQNFLSKQSRNLRYSNSQIEALRQARGIRDRAIKSARSGDKILSGTVRIPVILVGFQDRPFTKTKEDFEMLINQLGYNLNGATGSARDYFLANSFGEIDVIADVFGPYILPGNIEEFDMECGGNPALMARLAVDSAYHRGGADFSNYAVDENNVLKSVHIIFAGHGQENAGVAACHSIWSHAWFLGPLTVEYNGVTISMYSCSPEFSGSFGSNISHIGVLVHELGHSLLGLLDYYDYDRRNIDIGRWCLMAMGTWNDDGRTPAGLSAYPRVSLGWTTLIELDAPTEITIPNPETESVIYRIHTTTEGEYFLLENRQRIGWDAAIPASGLLIYAVDKNSGGWENNRINSGVRGYYIKQSGCASNFGCFNRDRDPWPQGTHTYFTDVSTPNSVSRAGNRTHKPVTNITHDTIQRTVSFSFMAGNPIYDPKLTILHLDTVKFTPITEDITVRFTNLGWPLNSEIITCTIVWTVNGVAQTPYVWTGNLSTGQSDILTLGAVNFSMGTHNIVATITITDGQNTGTYTLRTTVNVVVPFFFEDWETGTANWVLTNGSQVNRWFRGTATASEGQYSLYISNDEESNAYTITSQSRVHVRRDITFPVSSEGFQIFFDIKGMGQSNNRDYAEVRIAATTNTPSAGSVFNQGVSLGIFYDIPDWRTITVNLPAATYSGLTRRLVFSWYNDATLGTQPPIAIDNIRIVSLDPAAMTINQHGTHIFSSASPGYGPPTPLSVAVSNTGRQATGAISITLSGADANRFTLSKNTIADVATGANEFFTVVPHTGLDLGTYTATVTVEGAGLSRTFDVKFTVRPPIPTHTVHITEAINGTITVKNGNQEVYNGAELDEGTELTLIATAHENFKFIQWWDGSMDETHTHILNDDVTISATFIVDQTTSITTANGEKFIIHPNPTTGVLHIQTEQTIKQIFVLDLTGKVVMLLSGDHKTIDLQALPTGHYIIRIHTETTIVPIRIVKQ